jgi:HEAT repeat protein
MDQRIPLGTSGESLARSKHEAKADPAAADTDQTKQTLSVRRRRAVLAGHRAREVEALTLAGDPEPSVREAALAALARLGVLNTDELVEALADSDPSLRCRASRIAGQAASREPPLQPASVIIDTLTATLDDTDSAVAETAAWALGEWGQASGDAPTDVLCKMATEHSDPLCREAAVAALGAIRDRKALPSILTALEDKPAIRRRAAIALGAFDDPSAKDGLRRCLDDRDWQVRQAAEELLEDD